MYEFSVFLGLWAAVYVVTVAFYFGQGGLLIWLNNRNPERRIQKKRRGEDRARLGLRPAHVSQLRLRSLEARNDQRPPLPL